MNMKAIKGKQKNNPTLRYLYIYQGAVALQVGSSFQVPLALEP